MDQNQLSILVTQIKKLLLKAKMAGNFSEYYRLSEELGLALAAQTS